MAHGPFEQNKSFFYHENILIKVFDDFSMNVGFYYIEETLKPENESEY